MTTLGKTEERGLMSAREKKRSWGVVLLGLILCTVGFLVMKNPEVVLSVVDVFFYDSQLDRMQKYPILLPKTTVRYEDIGGVVLGGFSTLLIGTTLIVMTLLRLIFRNWKLSRGRQK